MQFKMSRARFGQGEPIASSIVTAPSERIKQNPTSAQPPNVDVDKTSKARKAEKEVATKFVSLQLPHFIEKCL